jgi:hypothetical protein
MPDWLQSHPAFGINPIQKKKKKEEKKSKRKVEKTRSKREVCWGYISGSSQDPGPLWHEISPPLPLLS